MFWFQMYVVRKRRFFIFLFLSFIIIFLSHRLAQSFVFNLTLTFLRVPCLLFSCLFKFSHMKDQTFYFHLCYCCSSFIDRQRQAFINNCTYSTVPSCVFLSSSLWQRTGHTKPLRLSFVFFISSFIEVCTF